jgi:hypothetical protein
MKFFRMLLGSKKEKLSAEEERQMQALPLEEDNEPQHPVSEDDYWFFLSYFWNIQEIDKDRFISSWSATLGRPYLEVIKEFISKGLLKQAGVKEKLAGMLRAQDLKQLLKEQGIKLSGTKDELLDRYIEARPREAKEKAATMGDAYICTPEGFQEVAQHAKRRADRRDSVDQEVRRLLTRGKIDQAAEVVIDFRQSVHYAPRDDNWIINEVRMVMDIEEMPGLTPAEVKDARINWAIERLWTGQTEGMFYSPIPKFYKFARFVAANIREKESQAELRGYSKDEFITHVEIMCNDDSCRKCKAAAGEYLLKEAPLLPIRGCTHEDGCRCSYYPIV